MFKKLVRWAFKARVARMERQIEFILAHPAYAWARTDCCRFREELRALGADPNHAEAWRDAA